MQTASWSYLVADYYAFLDFAAMLVAVVIIISALDDLFIDAAYWVIQLERHFAKKEKTFNPLTIEQLAQRPEQHLAVMVPAWMEYDVIAAMIENMVEVLNYKKYIIFVGTYVNDAATIKEVERMRRRYKQLRRVEVPNPGPTCKADCLNWIVQAIFLHEQTNSIEFAGVILHDSEDVLHPYELKFYNYLLPRKDMIQLPVFSLERKWYELVAGTYMDEFVESHSKDMIVRERVCGVVPSAGVGTCFSRRAILALNEETQNQPFNTKSLTEDYDIGNRLAHMGMQSIFAVYPVEFIVRRENWFNSKNRDPIKISMPLCIREYFPDTFRTAYRQKARWTLGICLQSWDQIEFRGTLIAKYFLLRDRKGILTSLISIVAYLIFIQFLIFQALTFFGVWTLYYSNSFTLNEWWTYVLMFNIFALSIRMGHRSYFVTKYYGWRHGIMSIPRMIISNFINFMAVCRAWKLYLNYLFLGNAMVWDKTMHDFPSADSLVVQRQKIGELLEIWQAVDNVKLNVALEESLRVKLPLGRVLISKGWLDDETLAEAIAFQSNLERGDIKAEIVKENSRLIPAKLTLRFRVIHLGHDVRGTSMLGVASPLSVESLDVISNVLGHVPVQYIIREGEIAAIFRFLKDETIEFKNIAQIDNNIPLLGDLLIQKGLVDHHVFEAAMNNYQPQHDGRIGDYLVAKGIIRRDAIEMVVLEQRGFAANAAEPNTDDQRACSV